MTFTWQTIPQKIFVFMDDIGSICWVNELELIPNNKPFVEALSTDLFLPTVDRLNKKIQNEL